MTFEQLLVGLSYATVNLTDDQWMNRREFVRHDPHPYVGSERACRGLVEAVLWIARSGAQWRFRSGE